MASTPTSTTTAKLDATLLTKTPTSNPRPLPKPDDLEVRLLQYHTDHMILVNWDIQTGWSTPSLQPFGPIPISPASSALHYANQCFEGLKVFRSAHDGRLRLFRPIDNCERMRRSAARVALPDFDARELEGLIVALCSHEAAKWLPGKEAGALYVRPTLIGTDSALATIRPRSALLYVFLTVFPKAVGSITGQPSKMATTVERSKGMKLLASREGEVRAWPGGYGNAKVGANYGPTTMAQDEAKARGYDQVLWLLGPERLVTEAGASNFFVVLRVGEKMWQVVTPSLEDGVILPGITRASVLQLARERLQQREGSDVRVEVVERQVTMGELVVAHEEGRIVEAFVTGTALFVVPVGSIHFEGQDLAINVDAVDGLLCSSLLREWLTSIMNGKEEHEWVRVIDEA